MLTKLLYAALLFFAYGAALPAPGQNVSITDAELAALESIGLNQRDVSLQARGQNVPITEAEWAALESIGLNQRDVSLQARGQNVPITEAEWTALKSNGLSRRSAKLQARDGIMSCGTDMSGKTAIGGNHVGWVPAAQFNASAQQFCNAYAGTDVAENHETSDTYGVTLTNQTDSSQKGASGNIVFAIYNTQRSPTYNIDATTCFNAMTAPMVKNLNQNNKNGKGDKCYGTVNQDYEGGYYSVDSVGAFGSEVSSSK